MGDGLSWARAALSIAGYVYHGSTKGIGVIPDHNGRRPIHTAVCHAVKK